MKLGKLILFYAIVILIGSLCCQPITSGSGPAGDWLSFFIVSGILSFPAGLVFIVIINKIAGQTTLSALAENLILIGIHLLLTALTIFIGYSFLFPEEFIIQVGLVYAAVGTVVWAALLFSNNKTKIS